MHKLFLGIISLFSTIAIKAQVTVSNPNSYYGIGELAISSDPIQRALGNSSLAYSDSTMVNFYNSATIASIVRGNPLFSLALNGYRIKKTEGELSQTNQYFGLEHFYFAVPFAKRFGLAFGLTPYSRRGYSFQKINVIDGDTLLFDYTGNGNSTKAFGSLSANIINNSKFKIAIGTNFGYIFGQTTNTRSSSFSGESKGAVSIETDRIRSFHYDFSLTSTYQINPKNKIQLSGYYDPSQNLSSTRSESLLYYQLITTTAGSSTSTSYLYSNEYSSKIISAQALKLGLNYTQKFKRSTKKNKDFHSSINYVLEYQKTDFSAFRQEFNETTISPYPSNFSRYSIGLQYTPNTDYFRNSSVVSFWNKVKYRIGAYSSVLPYQNSGENYKEFGTTFGFGIPLVMDYSFSSINIGVDLGKRTNAAAGAINENYIGLSLGVVLSPMSGDKWFRKVKLD